MESRTFRAEQKLAALTKAPEEAEKKWALLFEGLEATLKKTKGELGDVRVAFVECQAKLIEASRKNVTMEGQRRVNEARHDLTISKSKRAEADIRKSEIRESELALELDAARSQCRLQSQRICSEKLSSNAKDKALVDRDFRVQTVTAEAQSQIHILKQQMARSRSSKSDGSKELIEAVRARSLAQTMVQTLQVKLESEKAELSKQMGIQQELRQQIKILQKERHIEDKRFEGWTAKIEEMCKRKHHPVSILPSVNQHQPVSGRKASNRCNHNRTLVNGADALETLKADSQILRQMRTDLNRARTEVMTKSLEFARLQQHTEAISSKHAEARDLCHSLETKLEVVQQQCVALERSVVMIGQRCIRAESMAAGFESKLKEVKPDIVIDYSYKSREPSAKLYEVISYDDRDFKGNDVDNSIDIGTVHDTTKFIKALEIR
uniref:Uncharacterized protein n=1 Tax=Spongospora subterranea TaxID=70186 RepID=A0A0H5R3N4_9EUKA|eukprot:CRZ02649.1 hypothetical protein [Spongospora subterranea]